MVSSESNNKGKTKDSNSNSKSHASENAEAQDKSVGQIVGRGKDTEKEIAVIGDEDTVIAFGLTGIKHLVSIDDNTNDKELISSIKQIIEIPFGPVSVAKFTREKGDVVKAPG